MPLPSPSAYENRRLVAIPPRGKLEKRHFARHFTFITILLDPPVRAGTGVARPSPPPRLEFRTSTIIMILLAACVLQMNMLAAFATGSLWLNHFDVVSTLAQ